MTQILPVQSAGLPIHRHHRLQQCCAWSLEILLGLAIWIFASFASAQASPGPSPVQQKKGKQTPFALPLPQGSGATLLEPLPPAASEPAAPHAPQVTWDGKLLTVDADNSSLMQILAEVRAKTGATIEAPSSAANERVMLHIGPAPVREVLSALLYGTNFDYIIQAADDDEDGLRSVVLTARGASDDTTTPSAMTNVSTSAPPMTTADSTSLSSATTGSSNPNTTGKNIRMMPGWASPSKPKFQADAEAAIAARKAAEEQGADGSASTQDSTAATDPSAQGPGSVSMPTGNESASANSSSSSTGSSAPPVASTSPDSSAVADVAAEPTTSRPGSSDSGNSEQPSFGQMVQDMTHMFNQRKQIQAQQNQAAAAATQNQNAPPPSN